MLLALGPSTHCNRLSGTDTTGMYQTCDALLLTAIHYMIIPNTSYPVSMIDINLRRKVVFDVETNDKKYPFTHFINEPNVISLLEVLDPPSR